MVNYDGLYNKEYFGDKLHENHFSDKKLYFRIIEKGTILPYKEFSGTVGFGGISDNNDNFIEQSFVHIGVGGLYTPTEEVVYYDANVIYLGMFSYVWGHCITDNIKRLWFLKSDVYKECFKNCFLVYNPISDRPIPKSFFDLLKILDIDTDMLYPITRPVKFKNIILPEECFSLCKSDVPAQKLGIGIDGTSTTEDFRNNDGSFFTNEYLETIDQVRHYAQKNYSPMSQKKFYFFHGGKQIGEERIADYFHSKGYEIVQPGNLTLDEQLNIFMNCENWASIIGSVSHNIIFMKNNSNVILIPRRAAYLNIYQQALNNLYDLNIYYIDSAFSICTKKLTGPFCYIVSENLRKHFGDEITEKYKIEDMAVFLTYMKIAKSQGLNYNPHELIYFKNILPEFMEQLKKRTDLMKKFGILIK